MKKKIKLFKDQAKSKTGYLLYVTFGLILIAFGFIFWQKRFYFTNEKYSAPLETSEYEMVSQETVLPDDTQAQLVLIQFLEAVIQAGPPSSNPTSAREAVNFLSQTNQANFSEDNSLLFPELLAFLKITDAPNLGFRLDAFESVGENQMSGVISVNREVTNPDQRRITMISENGEWKIQSAEVVTP